MDNVACVLKSQYEMKKPKLMYIKCLVENIAFVQALKRFFEVVLVEHIIVDTKL